VDDGLAANAGLSARPFLTDAIYVGVDLRYRDI
jgi:hypothetical protein